jgi:hypothetical protein
MDTLTSLLAEAWAAGPNKFEFRDRVAAYGVAAVAAVEGPLQDPDRAAFAVRVLGRVPEDARPVAIKSLLATAHRSTIPKIGGDAEEELLRLGLGSRLRSSDDFRILDQGISTDGRPSVRFRTRAMESGHFTLVDPVMEALGLPINPRVELEVACRAGTFRVITKLESRNEVYPRSSEARTRDLARIRPYERIVVTVQEAGRRRSR